MSGSATRTWSGSRVRWTDDRRHPGAQLRDHVAFEPAIVGEPAADMPTGVGKHKKARKKVAPAREAAGQRLRARLGQVIADRVAPDEQAQLDCRRPVAAAGIAAGVAEPDRHHRHPRLVIKNLAPEPEPTPQPLAALVVKRQPGKMGPPPRRLTDDQQSRFRAPAQHRTRPERQNRRAAGAGTDLGEELRQRRVAAGGGRLGLVGHWLSCFGSVRMISGRPPRSWSLPVTQMRRPRRVVSGVPNLDRSEPKITAVKTWSG